MKKLFFSLFAATFLTGCVQSTAMIGPAMTLVSSGNATHAFGTFLTNKAVEEETGLQTHQFIAQKVEQQQIKNKEIKINKELSSMLKQNIEQKQLLILLQSNIRQTRKELNLN